MSGVGATQQGHPQLLYVCVKLLKPNAWSVTLALNYKQINSTADPFFSSINSFYISVAMKLGERNEKHVFWDPVWSSFVSSGLWSNAIIWCLSAQFISSNVDTGHQPTGLGTHAEELYGDAGFIFHHNLALAHSEGNYSRWSNHNTPVVKWPAKSHDLKVKVSLHFQNTSAKARTEGLHATLH